MPIWSSNCLLYFAVMTLNCGFFCSQLIFFINLFSSPYMMVYLKVLTLQAEKINLNKTDYGSKEKSSGSLRSSHFR